MAHRLLGYISYPSNFSLELGVQIRNFHFPSCLLLCFRKCYRLTIHLLYFFSISRIPRNVCIGVLVTCCTEVLHQQCKQGISLCGNKESALNLFFQSHIDLLVCLALIN